MAAYKVLQDVEAEDKLIGPLTLRQFIYAGVAAVMLYLTYFVISHGLAPAAALFLPVALAAGFFAFPWGRDQPTEVWALAKIRFMLKPRRRIWNQSGIKELVTITAPKKMQVNYTNNLSQEEVRSRLQALANTIDTRGWAIKNAGINLSSLTPADSDRLIQPAALPQPADDTGIQASDDMLDEKNNARAQRLQSMIDQSTKDRRSKIEEHLKNDSAAQPADYWFLNQPGPAAKIPDNMVTFNTQVVTPGAANSDAGGPAAPAADEANIVAELDKRKEKSSGAYYGHMRTIQPLSQQKQAQAGAAPIPAAPANTARPAPAPVPAPAVPAAAAVPAQNANAPVTPTKQAAILKLANNNDLNVATIAREADRSAPDEVVIKLH